MVVIMKREFTPEQLEAAVHTMEEGGVKVMVSKGAETTILGAEGNAEHIDQEKLSLLPGVERVMRVTEPYKKANRKYHPEDTVIELSNGRSVGGNRLAVIAGPCSVESEAQIVGVAQAVKASGAAASRIANTTVTSFFICLLPPLSSCRFSWHIFSQRGPPPGRTPGKAPPPPSPEPRSPAFARGESPPAG